MSEFTPGPWMWSEVPMPDGKRCPLVCTDLNPEKRRRFHYIARVFHPNAGIGLTSHAPSDFESLANARLIAAAPDLLAACERMAQYADGEAIDMARNAIAKAKGQSCQPT